MPQIRDSWEKRLQQRAERTAVLAAQKEMDDEIRKEKRVRCCARTRCCGDAVLSRDESAAPTKARH